MSAGKRKPSGCLKKTARIFAIILLLNKGAVAVRYPARLTVPKLIRLTTCLRNKAVGKGEAMQFLKAVFFLVLFCSMSCSSVLVTHDYNKDVNFTGFKTYGWHAIERSIEMNDLVINRVKEAVNRELQFRGFSLVQEKPDLFVAIHISTRQKIAVTDWGYATGSSWRRGYGSGFGGVSARNYDEGILMIDMVDAADNELVWRGTATDIIDPDMSPEERTQEINKAVALIMQEFPPAL
jgi:hypothetical protein